MQQVSAGAAAAGIGLSAGAAAGAEGAEVGAAEADAVVGVVSAAATGDGVGALK